jgi:hypothetical protein
MVRRGAREVSLFSIHFKHYLAIYPSAQEGYLETFRMYLTETGFSPNICLVNEATGRQPATDRKMLREIWKR